MNERRNPFLPPNVQTSDAHSWLLYLPAALCWVAATAFTGLAALVLFASYRVVSTRTSWPSANRDEHIAFAFTITVMITVSLGATFVCVRAGHRAVEGKWRVALVTVLMCFTLVCLVSYLLRQLAELF